MKRRRFFGALLAGASAFVVAPAGTVEAAPSEDERIKALVDDVLANPGKHLEIEARARTLMGGSLARAHDAEWSWAKASLTFEAMQADCEARGCTLGKMGEYPEVIYGHAVEAAPGLLIQEAYYNHHDLARVDAWRRGLHEQASRDLEDDTAMLATYLT